MDDAATSSAVQAAGLNRADTQRRVVAVGGVGLAAAAASMLFGGMMVERSTDVVIDLGPMDYPEPPVRRLPAKVTPERDPNHPAVIAAQARQARKAARQARGFVSERDHEERRTTAGPALVTNESRLAALLTDQARSGEGYGAQPTPINTRGERE